MGHHHLWSQDRLYYSIRMMSYGLSLVMGRRLISHRGVTFLHNSGISHLRRAQCLNTGTVRFDNTSAPLTTSIYISSTTAHGNNIGPLLNRLGNGDSIFLCTENGSNCKLFNITTTVINHVSWFELTVTFVSETGVDPFTDTELLGVEMFTIGNPFDSTIEYNR